MLSNIKSTIKAVLAKNDSNVIERIQRAHYFTDDDWVEFILEKTKEKIKNYHINSIILFGSGKFLENILDKFSVELEKKLDFYYIGDEEIKDIKRIKIIKIRSLEEIDTPPEKTIFVSCSLKNGEVTKHFKNILNNPLFKFHSDFIYKIRSLDAYSAFNKYEKNKSPVYSASIFDDNLINSIYEYSLTKTARKCQVQDAYDLYQLLMQVKETDGSVIEFGSFRGHSGLIISEIIKRANINKKIYLCDTFDEFPHEELSVDKSWNQTHQVNFNDIKTLFSDYPNVNLIKGDFFNTIGNIQERLFSLIYVDCDSYRGTKLVCEKMYSKLNKGGIIAFEDYGHDHCLGAREAIDEFFDQKNDCVKFFSNFSGLYLVIRIW